MRTYCTQVAGTWLVTFLKQTAQGYLHGPGFGRTSPDMAIAEVVGRNRVRWSAARLSNESALPRTTDSTPYKKLNRLDDGPEWMS